MKKLILVFCFLSLSTLETFPQENFFPLEVGNYWQFRATHFSSLDTLWVSYDVIKVLGDTLLGVQQNLFKKIKSIALAPYYHDTLQYLRYDITSNSMTEYSILEDSTYILFDYSAQLNDCWSATTQMCYNGIDTVEIFGENRLRKFYFGGSIPSFSFYLTEGLGPTGISNNQSYVITSYTVYDLVYAKINGVEYGQLVSISAERPATPTEFSLSQNYPNPFNPSTKIRYEIPLSPPLLKGESVAGGFVTLKVYDVLGKEVATLVNEYKPAGSYEVEFKSTVCSNQLANGVYFYQLKAGDFSETKKMTLLK